MRSGAELALCPVCGRTVDDEVWFVERRVCCSESCARSLAEGRVGWESLG